MKLGGFSRRNFLFLQGPHGPFFHRLGAALAEIGHGVHRINLNGGDRRDWPSDAVNFTGRPAAWPIFFDRFITRHEITDLVLFGDCRPMHRAAHGMAHLRQIRIHVFEEGYIRPDYVTLELDGVNGNSSLSRDPDHYLRAAATLPPIVEHPPVASSFARRAREAVSYYLATAAGRTSFPHYRSHRPISAGMEMLGWARRFASRTQERARSAAALKRIEGAEFFCFPLQLDSDHQIRVHSPFGNMKVAIRYVMESFARAAPPEALLLLKQHPLDPGLIGWRRFIQEEAVKHGLADRAIYLEDADVAPIIEAARGVVTVNSTTGTLALRKGVPTAVLGHAVYHMPRITHQGTLDEFWRRPVPPEADVYDAFCRVLVDRCLIHGGFLSEAGLDHLVRGAVERLTSDEQGWTVSLGSRLARSGAAG
ncbi:MAG: capsular biosynthesis protein [Sphingomonas fennica]